MYRLEPVKKDWNECLVAEVPVENMAKQMCWRDAREKPVPVMKMSEIEETVVQWLWYPFIPFGKVTLIQGNPGKGKTWLAMAIAAYCTNGKELTNALPIEPFNVLYQTAEDGIADTIKPRLAKLAVFIDTFASRQCQRYLPFISKNGRVYCEVKFMLYT